MNLLKTIKRNTLRSWLKFILKFVLGLIILFIIACLVVDHFIQFRMNDKELYAFFKRNNIKGAVRYYEAGGRRIRYISIGNDTLPTLFFIHGSPASLSIYHNYYKDSILLKKFKMYAVDRPGYGYSGLGLPEPSIQKQVEMISPVIDSLNQVTHPVIIVAGSYGTPIACRIAMDHPTLVDGLVLIGPSIAPGEEKTYWFTRAIENPLLNWFIPRMFQSANTEKLAHKEQLQKMLPYWKNIRIPVTYLQGENDELIYTSNLSFARKYLINVPSLDIRIFKNRPHFMLFTERETIKNKILEMLSKIKL